MELDRDNLDRMGSQVELGLRAVAGVEATFAGMECYWRLKVLEQALAEALDRVMPLAVDEVRACALRKGTKEDVVYNGLFKVKEKGVLWDVRPDPVAWQFMDHPEFRKASGALVNIRKRILKASRHGGDPGWEVSRNEGVLPILDTYPSGFMPDGDGAGRNRSRSDPHGRDIRRKKRILQGKEQRLRAKDDERLNRGSTE